MKKQTKSISDASVKEESNDKNTPFTMHRQFWSHFYFIVIYYVFLRHSVATATYTAALIIVSPYFWYKYVKQANTATYTIEREEKKTQTSRFLWILLVIYY